MARGDTAGDTGGDTAGDTGGETAGDTGGETAGDTGTPSARGRYRPRLRGREETSLVRVFAVRSAVAFVLVGVVLHFLVERLVEEQFHAHAEFHAEFVTEAVLLPKLMETEFAPGASHAQRAAVATALRRYLVDLDEAVYHVVVWAPDGTVLTADDTAHLEISPAAYGEHLARAVGEGVFSVDGAAPYLRGAAPVESTLRTFVPFETGRPMIAEVHQDWSPTLAASRRFSRTLDAGLVAGLGLLWALSLPIARRAGRRLHERSRTDELTELPNRTALEDRLGAALGRLEDHRGCIALLFVDLDGFKAINDTYGHAAGDEVLREIGERLKACTRSSDTVSRFAGDEFIVILEDTDDVLAGRVARRYLEVIRQPLDRVGGFVLSASIGMAATGDPRMDPDVLLRHADAAMYHVKGGGGGSYRVFDDELQMEVSRRNQVESQLRGAIGRGELRLEFQPFVPCRGPSRAPVAVEALLRWTHPHLGAVGPGEFIPLAERNGTIEDIGAWVIREACRHLADWQGRIDPARDFVVYVNLSAVQLHERLLAVVDRCLAETGADPRRLGFEITETAVLDSDEPTVFAVLDRLRRRGCRVALDDFGTGYSSLSRLRSTPLDLLKLDGSFVDNAGEDGRERAILTAVSRLAADMGIEVLVEGIETAEHFAEVTALGFDLAQGYHFARPSPAGAVPVWLDTGLVEVASAPAASGR